jgi:uncharacterized protein
MTVNIVVTGRLPENLTLIEAFPSRGYVSTIAANHMIKTLDMDAVGYIECDKLDAVAVVHDGKPMHPIRIYTKNDLVILFSELIIPMNLVHEFTTALGDWFKTIKPKRAFLLASVSGMEAEKEHEIISVSTDDGVKEKIKKLNLREMDEGVLTGMSSGLMIKCLSLGIPASSLMVETSYIPDVLASASLLKVLCEVLDLKIDVEELIKTGKSIEDKFRDNLEQMKKGQENYKELHQHMSSMYR